MRSSEWHYFEAIESKKQYWAKWAKTMTSKKRKLEIAFSTLETSYWIHTVQIHPKGSVHLTTVCARTADAHVSPLKIQSHIVFRKSMKNEIEIAKC